MWVAVPGYVAAGWLVDVVQLARLMLRGVWVCRPVRCVRRWSVGLPSLGACPLVPCPLGVPVSGGALGSAGWGGVVSPAWLVPLHCCLRASVSSPVLDVAAVSPFPSGVRALVPVCWPLQWKVAGVVAWRLGYSGGLSGALAGRLCGCSLLPLRGGRWLVGATPVWFVRCRFWVTAARHAGRAPLRWSV